MADSKRWEDWFRNAKSDCQTAEILLQHGGDFAIIAFHCQQAAEKAFKGFLLKHKNELFEGHSLIYLCRKAAEIDASVKEFIKDSAYLNEYYLATRYPSDIPFDIDKEEAEECLKIAKSVMAKVIDGEKEKEDGAN